MPNIDPKVQRASGPKASSKTSSTQKSNEAKPENKKAEDSSDKFEKKQFNSTQAYYMRLGEKLSDSYKSGVELVYDSTTGTFIEAKSPEEAEEIKKKINYEKMQMLKLSDGNFAELRINKINVYELNPEDFAQEMNEIEDLISIEADKLSLNQLEKLDSISGIQSGTGTRLVKQRESLVAAIKNLDPSYPVDGNMSGDQLMHILDDLNRGRGTEKIAPPKPKKAA